MGNTIHTIEKKGDDLLFNDVFSVPRGKISVVKRDGFCSMVFDQVYFSDTHGSNKNFVDIFPGDVTKPAGIMDNDDLFAKLVMLK